MHAGSVTFLAHRPQCRVMTGERWPDKRARAVLFAGASKAAKEHGDMDPDQVADAGLRVRELLFTDEEVREDTADAKQHQIGYTADCMQFATLQPEGDGLALGLWVGPGGAPEAMEELGAEADPNPFRSHFGWVRVHVDPEEDPAALRLWVERARAHAREQKRTQSASL
jgi:hypothetical protein